MNNDYSPENFYQERLRTREFKRVILSTIVERCRSLRSMSSLQKKSIESTNFNAIFWGKEMLHILL